jgi:hypothetical protein
MVATRFGTFFGTLNFVRFGTNFFCFGTAIVFFGTATRGGPYATCVAILRKYDFQFLFSAKSSHCFHHDS